VKRTGWSTPRIKGRLPPALARCPGCGEYIYPQGKACPHCGGKLAVLRRKQLAAIAKAEKALATLQRLMSEAQGS
jgi:ribosomal protein L32